MHGRVRYLLPKYGEADFRPEPVELMMNEIQQQGRGGGVLLLKTQYSFTKGPKSEASPADSDRHQSLRLAEVRSTLTAHVQSHAGILWGHGSWPEVKVSNG